ncbi:hypothetical protein GCM10010282_73270 [Streptomyces roseolus]|nr:hypothetical protein GCM10010282_73270 [Streptomyces roseolus]
MVQEFGGGGSVFGLVFGMGAGVFLVVVGGGAPASVGRGVRAAGQGFGGGGRWLVGAPGGFKSGVKSRPVVSGTHHGWAAG